MTHAVVADRVHVRAPGKLNLFFEVGDVQDDGYHEVASAYQAVSLYEDVWAEPAADFSVSVSGTVDVSGVPADDRNLALRAARLVAQKAGHTGGVHLDIVKHVPVAGGMGGGSADAAAALVACDALWGADLGAAQLHQLAARLGADVPFSLMGGTAIGTGRGDQLSPALAKGRFDWVVVPSDAGCRPPRCTRTWTRCARGPTSSRPPARPAVRPRRAARAARRRPGRTGRARPQRPAGGGAVAAARAAGGARARRGGRRARRLVSGSGPTLAFLAGDPESALELQVVLSAAGYEALHVHGPVHGARVL